MRTVDEGEGDEETAREGKEKGQEAVRDLNVWTVSVDLILLQTAETGQRVGKGAESGFEGCGRGGSQGSTGAAGERTAQKARRGTFEERDCSKGARRGKGEEGGGKEKEDY